MGTRNLTMVVSNGKTKVAQYGQWDGYPSGQGLTIFNFLKGADIVLFKKRVDKCKFITKKELKKRYADLGITGDFMNMEQANAFKLKYPQFDRDMAAEVLGEIYKGKVNELDNTEKFAGDSLFCEWAYVVDLDKNTFEVYSGFNQQPLTPDERFYPLQSGIKQREEKYYPVKLAASFELNNLPTKEEFLAIDKPEEEPQ